ncbi:ribonuclease HII [Flavobacteriaceae bacterium Ap0902]|nr:ribonuclease HII [Flavobacteriaceae bacterium Ap0902]
MKLSFQTDRLEAGCDEAGRGCLAGPVVAAAVILTHDFNPGELNDSKQLSAKKREILRKRIEEEAVCYGVGFVSPEEIDKINILNASFLAMHEALEQMRLTPDFIAVDGNRFKPFKTIPHQCCIKGDANYLNIAAASVLAKTYRDDYMRAIHEEYPYYDWDKNKGYPTKAHRDGIRKHGPSPYHRKSFTLLPPQLKLKI